LDKEGGIAKVMLLAHHTHERSADEAKTEHQKDQILCLIGFSPPRLEYDLSLTSAARA
jgi:hypothetical protein